MNDSGKLRLPLLSLLLVTTALAAEGDGTDEGDATMQAFIDRLPPDLVSDVEVFEANGFVIQSAQADELDAGFERNGQRFQLVSVAAEETFEVFVEKGRRSSIGGSVAIRHRESGRPMLAAADRSGDGRIDIIARTIVDDSGEAVMDVIDYEADGEPDLRVHLDEQGHAELRHGDDWYRLEKRGERRGIVIDGEFREVRVVDNRLTVQ